MGAIFGLLRSRCGVDFTLYKHSTLKRRIVRRPLDENERPIPASPEDFEEARRRYDESWRALAMEQEPGEEPGPPYSDRR